MKISIDEDVCKDYGLDLATVLAVLLVKTRVDIPQLLETMKEKEILVEMPESFFTSGRQYRVTQRWDDVCSNILLTSDKEVPVEDRIERLAMTLMEMFPKGKKEGTSLYWKGNLKDTKLKLKKFFKLYGDKYTDEDIIQATDRYIKSFNGNYAYMRVLKYFIWKDERKVDSEGRGYVEEVSDLATFIENPEEADNNNWTVELK